MNDQERRYTDREFASIMAAAAGPDQAAPARRGGDSAPQRSRPEAARPDQAAPARRGGDSAPQRSRPEAARPHQRAPAQAGRALQPRSGLTLGEVQAIAAEAGVAPEAVLRASRVVPIDPESEYARLAGGPQSFRLEFTVDGDAGRAAADRVLAAIRKVTAQRGSSRRTDFGLEWDNGNKATALAVNVTSAEGQSRVYILADRSTAAARITIYALIFAGTAFGIAAAILQPTGVLAVGALALGFAGAGTLLARALWARSTRRCRALLARLTTAVAEALENPAR